MVPPETVLTVFGLGLDVIGAGLLAVPDFPSLRTHTKQGEIENAILQLESNGLKPSNPAFDRVKNTLEDIYGFEIEDDIEGIRRGLAVMSSYPEYEVNVHRTDGDSYSPDTDLNWTYVRSVLAEKAVESEQKFRRIGFALLACGFTFQIVASVV